MLDVLQIHGLMLREKDNTKHVLEVVERLFARSTANLSKIRTSRSVYINRLFSSLSPYFIFSSCGKNGPGKYDRSMEDERSAGNKPGS